MPPNTPEAIADWAAQQVAPTPTATIGRPRRWQDAEAFDAAINAFFADCDRLGKPYTITALALHLGLTRRQLIEYAENAPEPLRNSIKHARARCEAWVEQQLLTRDKQVVGHIFWLKNNAGWRDVQEVETTHTLVVLGAPDKPLEPPALPTIEVSASPLSPQLTEGLHSVSAERE